MIRQYLWLLTIPIMVRALIAMMQERPTISAQLFSCRAESQAAFNRAMSCLTRLGLWRKLLAISWHQRGGRVSDSLPDSTATSVRLYAMDALVYASTVW
jgi:hypothetical protein